jgi:hypothetical protein
MAVERHTRFPQAKQFIKKEEKNTPIPTICMAFLLFEYFSAFFCDKL